MQKKLQNLAVLLLTLLLSCNDSDKNLQENFGKTPKKLIVNFKDVTNMKASFADDIKYELLYKSDDVITQYKLSNPQDAKGFANDIDLFYGKIYPTLEEWEKELHKSVVVTVYSKKELNRVKQKLQNDPNVNFIQENKAKKLHYIPNDPYYGNLWGAQKINCNPAWDLSEGNEIIVAVVDDGLFVQHEDIKDNLWKGGNNNYGFNLSGFGNFFDVNPTNGDYHGTHVAGTIAATANNNKGIIGVSPKAKIMSLKVFPNADDISCTNAFRLAIKNKANIINNSWGPVEREETNLEMSRIIDIAFKRNIVVIFSAGNDNDDVKFYAPANHPRVIAVAATDINDRRCNFSNFGTQISVSSPGKDILSLNSNLNGTRTLSGTSMSAPHVSGLCALLMKANPKLTNEQIKILLETSSTPILNPDRPVGFGRINAFNAVNTAIVTQSHSIQITYRVGITDHDDISSNEFCDFSYPFTFNLFPNGIANTFEHATIKCDDEVWVKINFSYSMDINKTLQISGVVYLFDDDNLQGSQPFNARLNYGQSGTIVSGQVSDGDREDQTTYNIIATNVN
jgi:thermitase